MSVRGVKILIGVVLLLTLGHHVVAQKNATSAPSAGPLGGQKLELILRSSKQKYVVGEPIYLTLEVLNRGNVPAEVPLGCCEQHINLAGPGLPDSSPSSRDPKETEVQMCSCPVVFTKVLPGKRYREQLLLNKSAGDEWFRDRLLIEHYSLKHSGTYKVKVALAMGGQGSSGGWLYAELDVRVTEATSK